MGGPINKVLVAGAAGMVGSAVCRALQGAGIAFVGITRRDVDLSDRNAVDAMYAQHQPDCVIVAAAKVGGIHANNTYPADFIYENLMIQSCLIDGAYRAGIERLLFLGSSCIYPKAADQPMKETALLTGVLEPTNEPYAIAKIAGIKMCESYNRQHGTDYRSLMPTNLYGPGDNFHPENSHVIPALIDRFHQAHMAKEAQVTVWGSGRPRREFLHVDDMASAAVHILGVDRESFSDIVDPRCSHINVGTGTDVTIAELAETVRATIGLEGELLFDPDQPDGMLRKLLDTSMIQRLGWTPKFTLAEGLADAYAWYLANVKSVRR